MSDPTNDPANAPKTGSRAWMPWGALGFLVVAALVVTAFAVTHPSWFGGSASDGVPEERLFDKTLLDLGAVDGIRLSDDNTTSQSFFLPVPLDSGLEDPVLTLRGHTEVAASGTTFLRVLVDGKTAYVDELLQGDHGLDADIDLPESSVEDGVAEVQVRMTGALDQRRCNLTTELGSQVVLDPRRTRVHGALDERLHTVRDVVAELNHQVTLVLAASEGDEEWFETAARLAAFLTQQGHDVDYADGIPEDASTPILLGTADDLGGLGWDPVSEDGSVKVGQHDDRSVLGVVEPAGDVVPAFLTTSAVTIADSGSSSPGVVDLERLRGDRVTLESLGVDTAVQQITDRRSWRVPYTLPDLPGGAVPTSVRVRILIPATTDDARWLVQVRLNDELADSIRVPGVGRQTVTANLPASRELLRNELVVTLVRDRDLGGCNVRRTSYDVQLLPGSTLVLDGEGAGFTAVPAQFSEGFDLVLPTNGLDDPAATLAGLVPTLAELSGWRQEATFTWDGALSGRPFLLVGDAPSGVAGPVTVADGRIRAAGLDIDTFENGVVVQCVLVGDTPGVLVTPVGEPDGDVPAYGREEARLVTNGGGFVVSASGEVVSAPTVRAESNE